jgi:hypothetical protein
MSWMLAVLFIGIGVALTFGMAFGIDWVKSWYYRTFRLQEMRERPAVPGRVEQFEVNRTLSGWAAKAYNSSFPNHRVEIGWAHEGTHPMDAIRNVIELIERDEQGRGEG